MPAKTTEWDLNVIWRQALLAAGTAQSIWRADSEIGRAWDAAYERWMRERAQRGDAFAIRLGYGAIR